MNSLVVDKEAGKVYLETVLRAKDFVKWYCSTDIYIKYIKE